MTETRPGGLGRWRGFWERGGWWRAVVLAAGYYLLYQLGGLLFVPLTPGLRPDTGPYVFVEVVLPIALGGVLLVLFGWSVGWLRQLFGPQPVRGRGWMWVAVIVVLGFNALHFAGIDYPAAGFGLVAAWLLAGLVVGFAEEVLTRGFVVDLMRRAGHSERAVALVSAAVFAALHAGNLLAGQPVLATALQLLYTFAFGICMYLSLRVTGTIVAPILLHASTDPSIFLLGAHPAGGTLTAVAGLGNFAVIAVGVVAIFFIRGRVAVPSTEVISTGQLG